MNLREMTLEDLPEVAGIEAASFQAPWSEEDYQTQFTEAPDTRGLVAEVDGRMVGYLIHQPTDVGLYIVAVAVHEDFRRRGIATRMFREVIDLGETLSLHVRVSDRGAQSLYRRLGFVTILTEPQLYEDNGEDAILMLRP